MKASSILLNLLFVSVVPTAFSASFKSAIISEKDSSPPKRLYTIERQASTDALISIYKDLDGKVIATETLRKNGEALRSFQVEQHQLNYTAMVEVEDHKLRFEFRQNGHIETKQEDSSDNVVVGPLLVSYLQKHWSAVLRGENIKVRFVVLDRKETIAFVLSKVSSSPFGNVEGDVILKMRPNSVILRALVNPIYLRFDPEGSKLRSFKGRVLPKRADGKKWKDLDADVVYSY